ncbi:unnamed protein product [Pleuronectes platessa]|uniref:Uncharacterized protein n=1 Tax=Pleuronectes platessa TaxID=8262 RepID=A0A9N7VAK9_PLEPL|nr:unnamed protein product [Pleuronectes platessa]
MHRSSDGRSPFTNQAAICVFLPTLTSRISLLPCRSSRKLWVGGELTGIGAHRWEHIPGNSSEQLRAGKACDPPLNSVTPADHHAADEWIYTHKTTERGGGKNLKNRHSCLRSPRGKQVLPVSWATRGLRQNPERSAAELPPESGSGLSEAVSPRRVLFVKEEGCSLCAWIGKECGCCSAEMWCSGLVVNLRNVFTQ